MPEDFPIREYAKPLLACVPLTASTAPKKAVATQRFNAMDATGSYAVAAPAVASITKPRRGNEKSEIADSPSPFAAQGL